MTPHLLSSLMRRVALREWLSLLAALLLLALGLGWQNGLGRLDQTLYDQLVSFNGRPARDDIIIVAIDEHSLSELGRWPWPRKLHAELVQKIGHANPRIIGLDLILSEPERPAAHGAQSGDLALAEVLQQNRRTVLPLVAADAGAGLTASLPIPALSGAARALGHINLQHDSDGVVRSTFLHEGRDERWWPHFALALADPDGKTTPVPRLQPEQSDAPDQVGRFPANWRRAAPMHIPFAGNSGHFRSVPYVSVLRGEVPAEFFAGKYVLIGATAIGLSDSYPTPVSGRSGVMSGIEINANILASLLDHKSIAPAQAWQTACFSAIPVLLALFCYLVFPPRIALLAGGALLLLTLVASAAALRGGLWLPPSAALLTLIVSYPLWSWRRLEAAIAYLAQEFNRLDREPHLLPEAEPVAGPAQGEDILERRINAMKNAARRVRDLRQFVSESLDNLPDATLVADTGGHILLANKHANAFFTSIAVHPVDGASLLDLLSRLKSPQPIDQAANAHFAWRDLLDLQRAPTLAGGVGVRDEHGRDLLIKSAPCHSASNVLTGWIISIVDISAIRSAERSRDETLRFLSHDMRSPQASILALLELQNEPASALPQPEFFARIEKASRKTLGLADNFVQLARAESQEYRLEEVDFRDIVYDASDEMWTLAKNKNIKLISEIGDGEYPVRVDRALMTRALVNLLSNAINCSPEHTAIVCTVRHEDTPDSRQIACSVADQGFGIEAADQLKLFRRFQRVDHPGRPRQDGIGLGLVFVKTVVERHHGQIRFSSRIGVGTTFTLVLPGNPA